MSAGLDEAAPASRILNTFFFFHPFHCGGREAILERTCNNPKNRKQANGGNSTCRVTASLTGSTPTFSSTFPLLTAVTQRRAIFFHCKALQHAILAYRDTLTCFHFFFFFWFTPRGPLCRCQRRRFPSCTGLQIPHQGQFSDTIFAF